MNEPDLVRERYKRRSEDGRDHLYHPADYCNLAMRQERERHIAVALRRHFPDMASLSVLEIGCGGGSNILDLLRLGCVPENLVGNELLEPRAAAARRRLPPAVAILEGDAVTLPLAPASFDVVLQSTVFTSLLDDEFQASLAARMWSWVKPGGGVLWYDFVYNNPANPDVRGVPVRRVRELFPGGLCRVRRVTLAPPIARRVTRVHPSLYSVFNALPFLRTHVLCWIEKSATAA